MRRAEALGLFVGMIVGAGMFAMPYAVGQAGLLWSLAHFLFAAIIVTIFHLLYGFVILAHDERDEHRLPGYMGEHFGNMGYSIALVSRLFSYFGYLLAYGVLSGLFLTQVFSNVPASVFSAFFFVCGGLSLLLNLKKAGEFNFVLTVALVLCIVALFLYALPFMHMPTVGWYGDIAARFLPYGIFLFAFSGASIIPEVVDMLGRRDRRSFVLVTIATTILVGALYLMFTGMVLGLAQGSVTEEGLSVLGQVMGRGALLLGLTVGFLAVATSYFTLGLELRFTFEYDLAWSKVSSWLIVAIIPPLVFFLGINNFAVIVSLVGAIGIGIEGICIMLLARKVLRVSLVLVVVVLACLSVGAGYEIIGALALHV